jgi:hypothetical protein
MSDKTNQDVVFGRVALPGEATFDTSEHRVEAWSGDRRLASALTDKKGRVRLDLKRADLDDPVELRVFAPWGTEIERRTLSPVALAASHELLLRAALPPDILSSDGSGVPIPRVVSLVSQADLDIFHAVTALAAFGDYFPHAGGPLAEVGQIYELLGDLEAVYYWAYGVLRGDPRHIRSLKSLLESFPCFETGHHDVPDDTPIDTKKLKDYLAIEDAHALPLAGVLLDAMDLETKAEAAEHSWSERAQCYYLGRAAILQRVFGAAASVATGAMELEVFAAVLRTAAARPAHTESPDVGEGHDQSTLIVPVEQWDDATIFWARNAKRVQASAKEKIGVRDIPPLVDRVEPAAVAEGQATTLTLFPAAKSRFPSQPQGKLDGILAYWQRGRRHLLKISSWTESAIEVQLPPGLAAGRGTIYWEPPTPPFAERILKPRPEPPSDEKPLVPYRVPGQIEVPVLVPYVRIDPVGNEDVGVRSVSFPDPGGVPHWELERFVSAESCTEVRLSWEGQVSWSSEPLIGGAIPDTVRLNTTILANGEVLDSSTRASGEIVADPRVSTRYEVQTEAHIGSVSLGVKSAAFSVDRYAQIRLEVADRVYPFEAPVPVTVRISCPAPAGGLWVRFTSHPALLTSGTVRVLEGQTSRETSLLAGVGPGAFLTAIADGHRPDTAFVHLGNTSCVPHSPRFGGEWQIAPAALNVVGVHIAVLHTGKVLLFSYNEGHFPMEADRSSAQWLTDILSVADSNLGKSQLWDPDTNAVTTVPLPRNLFCSGHAFLPDGRLFVAGGQFHVPVWVAPLALLGGPLALAPVLLPFIGLLNAFAAAVLGGGHNYDGADKDLHVFSPSAPVDSAWTRLSPDMRVGRWYPTCVTLPSGEVMVISGTSGALAQRFDGGIQDSIEIFDPVRGTRRALIALDFYIRHLYPFMHVLPSGKVFLHWMLQTALFDPGTTRFDHFPGVLTNHPYSRTGPGPGTSVLLPLLPTRARNGHVSYPAGKVLILGGGGAEGSPEPPEDGRPYYGLSHYTQATKTAEIWDFGGPTPEWRPITDMHNERVMPDSVLLPNGKVLVLHGARKGMAGAFFYHLGRLGPPRDAVLEAELFDPETETWERLCPATIRRIYHATAALLPDGRVLVAGHDGLLNNFERDPGLDADGHANEENTSSKYRLEVFSPPYLFRGPRPVIRSAPGSVEYSNPFQIEMGTDLSEVESVCLIRQSSQTHQINTDQRYVGLAIIPTMSRTSVTVQAPPSPNIAPPGFYMLFVVNRQGVPSIAKWVHIA